MKTMLMSLILGLAPLIGLADSNPSGQGTHERSNKEVSNADPMDLFNGVSDPGSLLFFAEKRVGGLTCDYTVHSKSGESYNCSLDESFDAKAISNALDISKVTWLGRIRKAAVSSTALVGGLICHKYDYYISGDIIYSCSLNEHFNASSIYNALNVEEKIDMDLLSDEVSHLGGGLFDKFFLDTLTILQNPRPYFLDVDVTR